MTKNHLFQYSCQRMLILFLIAAMVLPLAACGKGEASDGSSSSAPSQSGSSTDPSTSESSGQEGSSEESADDGDVSGDTDEAILSLSCLLEKGSLDVLCAGAAGEALAMIQNMDGTKIYRVDLLKDEILAESEIEPQYWLMGRRENGEIVAYSFAHEAFVTLDEDLKALQEIPFASSQFSYSQKEDCIYSAERGELTRIFFGGSTETVLSLHNNTMVQSVDTENGYILTEGLSEDDDKPSYCAVYGMDGQLVSYFNTDDPSEGFANGQVLVRDYDAFGEFADDKAQGLVTFYEAASSKVSYSYACSNSLRFSDIPGTDLLLAVLDTFDDKTAKSSTEVFLFNMETGELSPVRTFDDCVTVTAAYCPADERILIASSLSSMQELLWVTPSKLTVGETLEVSLPEETESTPASEVEVASQLKEARDFADQLEETYGITILIGNQVEHCYQTPDYDYVLTSSLSEVEEASTVMSALKALDQALKDYPEDFFRFFKNPLGKAGLRVLLVYDFVDTVGTFSAAGVQYNSGGWYNVALACDFVGEITHHELWHAIEERVGAEGYSMEGDEVWDSLNPEGFEYAEDHDTYHETAPAENLLGVPDHDMVYFWIPYSTMNSKEDRATLVEYLFRGEDLAHSYEFIKGYPHLYAKLQYMEGYLQKVYGYIYWEEMMK